MGHNYRQMATKGGLCSKVYLTTDRIHSFDLGDMDLHKMALTNILCNMKH